MEINVINQLFGIRSRGSLLNTERISTRVIENRDSDGDNQLNVEKLDERSGILNKVNSTSNNSFNQEELFSALTKRLEEKNNISIQVSVNINVIKANLGSLLSNVLNRSDSNTLTNIFSENRTSVDNNQLDSSVRERFINASIIAGIGGNGLFNNTGTQSTNSGISNTINPFTTNQNNGSQLLLNLLTEELGTPDEDAIELVNVLLTETFRTVA